MNRAVTRIFVAVACAAVVNYAVVGWLAGTVGFNIGRIVIAALGGWYVVSYARSALWIAACVGPFAMLIDHVILKGGYFVIADFLWPDMVEGQGLLAAAGVLMSFAMFAPLAALCSWLAGVFARRHAQRIATHA